MSEIVITKNRFDLEDRTYKFAKDVSISVNALPRSISNLEYIKQVVRSSGSVGANYIEANEALSKKDFLLRIKICRKEAKESEYWLRLITDTNTDVVRGVTVLINEATQLRKIFGAIITNVK